LAPCAIVFTAAPPPPLRSLVGTLTYFVNGASQGVCFRGLVGRTVYPAVCFYKNNIAVSITRCEEMVDWSSIPPFDTAVSSPSGALSWDHDNHTATSTESTNAMAVAAAVGFGRCRAVWTFRLDGDESGNEMTAFGATVKPVPAVAYDNGTMPLMYRAFNGQIYGRGAVRVRKPAVHPGDRITFEWDGCEYVCLRRVGERWERGESHGGTLIPIPHTLPPLPTSSHALSHLCTTVAGTLAALLNGRHVGIVHEGLTDVTLYPAVCFYGPSRAASLVRCTEVLELSPTPASLLARVPKFDAGTSGPREMIVFDNERHTAVCTTDTSEPKVTALAEIRVPATHRATWSIRIEADVSGNEGICVGATNSNSLSNWGYEDESTKWMYRAYNGECCE